MTTTTPPHEITPSPHRLDEKPSFWRRLAQFLCSHRSWQGMTLREDDGEPVLDVSRCLVCGYMTWREWRSGRQSE